MRAVVLFSMLSIVACGSGDSVDPGRPTDYQVPNKSYQWQPNSVADSSVSDSSSDAAVSCIVPVRTCTYSLGWWEHNPADWACDTLDLSNNGSIVLDQSQMLTLLNMPSGGNAVIILAHQIIPALLNGGLNDACIASVIQQAEQWMTQYGTATDGSFPAYVNIASTPVGGLAHSLSNALDNFNQGLSCVSHCNCN